MSRTKDLKERYRRACALKNRLDEAIIADRVRIHYRSLGVNPRPLRQFTKLNPFWQAVFDSSSCRAHAYCAPRASRAAQRAALWGENALIARGVWVVTAASAAQAVFVARENWAIRAARRAAADWPNRAAMISASDYLTPNLQDATCMAGLCVSDPRMKNGHLRNWLPIFEAMENGLWLYFYSDKYFGWLPQPKVVVKRWALHNETGPAFELYDEKLYFLNGVMVTKDVVMTPAAKMNPAIVLREKNLGVRREIIRKIGIERIVARLGAKVYDKMGGYELISVSLGEGTYRPYLKMRHPSLKTWHLEGVHPDCRTVQEALNWRRYGEIDGDWSPSVLT